MSSTERTISAESELKHLTPSWDAEMGFSNDEMFAVFGFNKFEKFFDEEDKFRCSVVNVSKTFFFRYWHTRSTNVV
jgi:hypothetical protein